MYAVRLPTAFTSESCDFPSFHLSAFRNALRRCSKIIGGFQLKSFCLAMCHVIRISVAERWKNIWALVTLGEDLKYDERKRQQFLHKRSESRMICLLFVAIRIIPFAYTVKKFSRFEMKSRSTTASRGIRRGSFYFPCFCREGYSTLHHIAGYFCDWGLTLESRPWVDLHDFLPDSFFTKAKRKYAK